MYYIKQCQDEDTAGHAFDKNQKQTDEQPSVTNNCKWRGLKAREINWLHPNAHMHWDKR